MSAQVVDSNLVGTRYNLFPRGPNGLIGFTNGPATLGRFPSVANPYTGYWAVWYNPSFSTLNSKKVDYIGSSVQPTDTGTVLNYYPTLHSFHDPSNLTACFDNSGQFFLGIQDNTTSPPTIRLAGNTGGYSISFTGYNPVVGNLIELNSGYYQTGGSLLGFNSGTLTCLYTDQNKDNLYIRSQSDNFAAQNIFSLSGVSGFLLWAAGSCPAQFTD